MNKRELMQFLVLQIVAVLWALLLFRISESRLVAGALAGSFFLISAAYMLIRCLRWSDRWRSATWYMLLVQFFGISLPMMVSRLLQIGNEFTQVQILGLPGPVFHRLAGIVFVVLVLATIVDLVRVARKHRNPKHV